MILTEIAVFLTEMAIILTKTPFLLTERPFTNSNTRLAIAGGAIKAFENIVWAAHFVLQPFSLTTKLPYCYVITTEMAILLTEIAVFLTEIAKILTKNPFLLTERPFINSFIKKDP